MNKFKQNAFVEECAEERFCLKNNNNKMIHL